MAAERKTSPAAFGIAFAVISLILIALVVVNSPGRGAERGPAVAAAPMEPTYPAEGSGLEFGVYGLADLVDAEWLAQASEATGIPQRALAGYAGAEIAFRDDLPGCRLDWSTLAGIGYVESRHGTLQGGLIDESGQQSPEMFGIALDGVSTAEVPDTDGGVIDGDEVWDRAVGPLQFIPSTWAFMGADGNRDGVKDPQNIDDAALAAARYLCRVGEDLSDPENWISAVHEYNRSVVYNNAVVEAADRYRSSAADR